MKMYLAVCKNDESDTDSVFVVTDKGKSTVLFSRDHPDGTWRVDIHEDNGYLKDWKRIWKVSEVTRFADIVGE